MLEAEKESLKEFVKTSASQEHRARKELCEKHARDLAELNEKLEKSQGRTVTMISKNKALEAEAEAIDKLIFRKRFPCCCSNYPASFISNGNCFLFQNFVLGYHGNHAALACLQFFIQLRQVAGMFCGQLLPRLIFLGGGCLHKVLEGFIFRLKHLDLGGQLVKLGVPGSLFCMKTELHILRILNSYIKTRVKTRILYLEGGSQAAG